MMRWGVTGNGCSVLVSRRVVVSWWLCGGCDGLREKGGELAQSCVSKPRGRKGRGPRKAGRGVTARKEVESAHLDIGRHWWDRSSML